MAEITTVTVELRRRWWVRPAFWALVQVTWLRLISQERALQGARWIGRRAFYPVRLS